MLLVKWQVYELNLVSKFRGNEIYLATGFNPLEIKQAPTQIFMDFCKIIFYRK